MDVRIDAEFRDLIPPLSKEEYSQLEKNILTEGCREAVIVWGCTVIDGHNRHRICTEHGIEFKIYQKDFRNRRDVAEWIITNQLGRRNLSSYDRSILALKYESVIKERANEKLRETAERTNAIRRGDTVLPEKTKPIDTRAELAKIADVSDTTIHKVKFIEEHGDKEIKDKIRGNGMSINAAYKKLRGDEKKAGPIEYTDIYNRRVTVYPSVRVFQMHIASSHQQLLNKGEVAEMIMRLHYESLPAKRQQELLDHFKKMTPEQIENTGSLKTA